jgi:hypothetical protein
MGPGMMAPIAERSEIVELDQVDRLAEALL